MFKFLGLALIFAMCCLFGVTLSLRLTQKEQELKDIMLMLDKLKAQISYSHTAVKQILKTLSREFPKLHFIEITYLLMCDKYSFKTAWEKAILESNLSLKKSEIDLVRKLGNIIGAYDTATQINEIKVIESFLNASLDVYSREKKEKSRLYQSLGVLLGLMLVMIMV